MAITIIELLPILVILACLIGLLLALYYVRSTSEETPEEPQTEQITASNTRQTPSQSGVRRRRGGLSRMRRAAEAAAEEEDDETTVINNHGSSSTSEPTGKRKKKKEANREAKREAQEARRAALEARREREAREEEKRLEREEKEQGEEESLQAEAKRIAKENEKKQQEEYEEWKGLISVEDTGDAAGDVEKEDPELLEKFCSYVREHKVVVLEDLAGEFDLRTEDVVQRLTTLLEMGSMSGFFDDRGKFLYVSLEEMKEVAKFIEKRGRVSIQELAKESSRLLHLETSVGG